MKKKLSEIMKALMRVRFGTKLVAMLLALVTAFLVVPTVVYAEAADAISSLAHRYR